MGKEDPPQRFRVYKPESLGDSRLKRLRHILHQKREHEDGLNQKGLRLLDHSAQVTYEDCIRAGRKDEADSILEQSRVPGVFRKTPTQHSASELSESQEESLGSVILEEE